MTNLTLELSEDELSELCRYQDTGRSKTVSVPRGLLGKLLRDHSRAIGAAERRLTVVRAPSIEDAARRVA